MLRLLAQREQGYDDIAALTGPERRRGAAKVKDASPGSTGPEPGPEGDAAPARPARRGLRRHRRADRPASRTSAPGQGRARRLDEAPATAPEPAAEPPAPHVRQPPEPELRQGRREGRARAGSRLPGGLKLPEDKGVRRALAAGGAVVVVFVLLLVTGVLGGDDDGDSARDTATAPKTRAGAEADHPGRRQIADRSGARGRRRQRRQRPGAVRPLRPERRPAAQRERPRALAAGQSYTVSLVRSPTRAPAAGRHRSRPSPGIISGRFQVAPQVLGLLAGGFDEMEVSLVDDDVCGTALAQARKSKKAPDYEGTDGSRGAGHRPDRRSRRRLAARLGSACRGS